MSVFGVQKEGERERKTGNEDRPRVHSKRQKKNWPRTAVDVELERRCKWERVVVQQVEFQTRGPSILECLRIPLAPPQRV